MQYSQIILDFINSKGISFYKVAKDTGISESTFSKWKSKPTSDISYMIIDRIADYFSVSPECLLKGEPVGGDSVHISGAITGKTAIGVNHGTITMCSGNERELSDEELELLRVYGELDVRGRTNLLKAAFDLEEKKG